MLVPDIPLPPGYTQKCTACGKVNLVADQYGSDSKEDAFQQSMDPADILDFSSGSHDFSSNSLDSRPSFSIETEPASSEVPDLALLEELQGRIGHLQSQIDAIKEDLAGKRLSPVTGQSALISEPDTSNPLFSIPVAEKEALFCTDQQAMANICARKLRTEGIQTQILHSVEEANRAVSELAFQYIIIDQRLLHGKPEGSKFLSTLKNITLPIRRQQVVALLTPGIETGESQVFYQWGIDVNIHFNDLEILSDILKETVDAKKKLYSNYRGLEIV